jgi:hypothetical protein
MTYEKWALLVGTSSRGEQMGRRLSFVDGGAIGGGG